MPDLRHALDVLRLTVATRRPSYTVSVADPLRNDSDIKCDGHEIESPTSCLRLGAEAGGCDLFDVPQVGAAAATEDGQVREA